MVSANVRDEGLTRFISTLCGWRKRRHNRRKSTTRESLRHFVEPMEPRLLFAVNLVDYYPIDLGATWVYDTDGNAGNAEQTAVIAGFEQAGGIDNAARIEYTTNQDSNLSVSHYDTRDATFGKLIQIDAFDAGSTLVSHTTYNPPFKELPPVFDVGQSYNYDNDFTTMSMGFTTAGNHSGTIEVIGFEMITTSLGTFNALKLHDSRTTTTTVLGQTTTLEEENDIWIVKCIGEVYAEVMATTTPPFGAPIMSEGTRELLSFTAGPGATCTDEGGNDPTDDFGDAPASYGSASHTIDTNVRLGATVDAEAADQFSDNADGDGADEDGVTFETLNLRGRPTFINIETTPGGFLYGWIDYNQNGSFDDQGEQFANGIPSNFSQLGLAVTIPVSAQLGDTYARFRYTSTNTGLGPTGAAADGEVEDYKITIGEGLGTGSIGNFAFNDLDGDGIQDAGEPGVEGVAIELRLLNEGTPQPLALAFQVTGADGSYHFANLPPGEYELRFNTNDLPDVTDVSPFQQGGDSGVDSDIISFADKRIANIVLADGQNDDTRDAGFIVENVDLDYGDADESLGYKVTAANDGARHIIIPNFYLGSGVDTDADGQPSANGLGDDNDGNDDEDGIDFQTPIEAGRTANIGVTAVGDGYVNAWLDFNQNGVFEDPSELIVARVQITGPTGLSFDVPADATLGPTFARFRYTSFVSSGPDGTYPDGEVEDYLVNIGQGVGTASVSGFVWQDLNSDGIQDGDEPGVEGASVRIQAADNANYVLDSQTTDVDGNYTFDNLPAGEYKVVYTIPAGSNGASPADVGADDTVDSDATAIFGPTTVITDAFTVADGEDVTNVDAGFLFPVELPTVGLSALDGQAGEPSNPGSFVVSRLGATDNPLVVVLNVSGTATAGSDYTTNPASVTSNATVTIPAGESQVIVTINPIDDDEVEGDETVVLTIVADAAYIVDTGAVTDAIDLTSEDLVTLAPDVTIEATDASANETTADTGSITITRSGATDAPLDVHLTISGTATNGVDYATLPSVVTIPAGESSVVLTVTPLADANAGEPDEKVVVTLAIDAAYNIGAMNDAEVTIVDDSTPAETPTATIDDDKNTADDKKFVFTDADGNETTVQISGPGFIDIYLVGGAANNADIAKLVLRETDPSKTKLTVKVKKASGADNETSIASIEGTGAKSIDIRMSDLVGPMTLTGALGELKVDDILAGAHITLGGTTADKFKLTADRVDFVNLTLPGLIDKLQATEWLGGAFSAIGAKSIATKGNSKENVAGNYNVDMVFTGDASLKKTLDKLTVAGDATGVDADITGDVNSVTIKGKATDVTFNVMSVVSKITTGPASNFNINADEVGTITTNSWVGGGGVIGALKSLTTKANKKITGEDGEGNLNDVAFNFTGIPAGSKAKQELGKLSVAGSSTGVDIGVTGEAGNVEIKGAVDELILSITEALKSLKLGDVSTAAVTAGSTGNVQVVRWVDGAASFLDVKNIKSTGDKKNNIPGSFGPDVTVNEDGTSTAKSALGGATITDDLSGEWNVTGDSGNVTAGDVAGWTGNILGEIKALTSKAAFASSALAAFIIGKFDIKTGVSDSDITAAGSDGPNTVGTFKVGDAFDGSTLTVGDDPRDENDSVKSMSIGGAADGAGIFAAGQFPKSVKIDGVSVDPLADDRFDLT